MIVVIKHNKCGNMVYISHIDLMRHFTRTFRRAGLEVEFSNGFNPHMLLNLGTPLPLGVNSCCEYFTVHTPVCGEEFLARYNAAAPEGLEGLKAFTLNVNPNIAGSTVAADYNVKQIGAENCKAELEGIVNLPSFCLPMVKKGVVNVQDVAPLINAIKVKGDDLTFNIAAGNTTLRADKFAVALSEKFGFEVQVGEVWKFEQYIRYGGVLCDVDTYLTKLMNADFKEGNK